MSSDPTTADTLGTSRRHDPDDLADPVTAADTERPNSADPVARVEAEQADEHIAAELDAEATQRQPLSQDYTDEPHGPTPIPGAEADATADLDAPGSGGAWEPQPTAMPTTIAPLVSNGYGHPAGTSTSVAASAQVTPALETNGAEPHNPSPVDPVAALDAEPTEPTTSTELSAAPETEHTDGRPFEPAAEYPVQPTWAQQPTYADAPPWSQQPVYAAPAPLLPDDPSADSWADSSYALPVYAPPPSGYAEPRAQPLAQPATGYAPAVYAPLAPARQRSRWPLVLGTVTAVLIVAALGLALASYGLNLFGRPLYQNSLTSVAGGWPNDAECHFGSDGYHITSANNCYYDGGDYRDVTISVTTKLLKGNPTGAYGIAFRRPSPNNFYVFLITGNGDWLVLKNAVPLQKATQSTALQTGIGAINQLSVHVQGSHFSFFANGVQLGSLSDGTYSNGNVGLAGDASIEVVFNDFTVTRG